jgi:hypothetical protein
MATIDIQIRPSSLIERLMAIAPIHIGPETLCPLQALVAQRARGNPVSQLIALTACRQMARMGTNRQHGFGCLIQDMTPRALILVGD